VAIGVSDERLSNKVGWGALSGKGAGTIKAKDGQQAGKLGSHRPHCLPTFAPPQPYRTLRRSGEEHLGRDTAP
jgi:hypothetical protein